MTPSEKHHERIRTMKFFGVYPHYVTKVEKKGRTVAELHEVITWLTGYDEESLQDFITSPTATFEDFFAGATLNPNAHLIKGVICGYRVEEIENDLTRQCRYLDKLVDELARGRKMEKILRVG
ncbi:DUF2200 domain-containing protein [Lewinella sp. 4G2]|uniref:DUF2200 domain-containing protein n=1 Tax=Lewinella sp. 4G2 TaxID=1803372 RepID=UPI0007B4BAA2|nr:DUF2200 domain-containing protein [Lewinella sp. 4G2]OAV44451.1 hypothetical protein A3850_008095 [Lewinella sp. 4G2]